MSLIKTTNYHICDSNLTDNISFSFIEQIFIMESYMEHEFSSYRLFNIY